MEEKYNAICIRSVGYKDNDKMLTLFTLENGLVDCVLRGVKKPNAKLKFAGEVFCFAEYVLVEKNGRRTVIEANEIDGFYELRLDIEKYYSAMGIVEFLRGFCHNDEANYQLFLNTVNVLKAIEKTDNPMLCLVKYYIEGLKIQGYGITFDNCNNCHKKISARAFFDFDDCVFKCQDCADISSIEMRIKTFDILFALDKIDLKLLKNNDLSTYSPLFVDLEHTRYALKFYDFFIREKANVTIKSNTALLEL